MKNFIKRTFTKAIAVAAAATIATGVLAGCNVQTDVEKEDVETGFQHITQSVEIDNETFSMTVNGYEYDNDSKILTVNVTATNASDQEVTFADDTSEKGNAVVTAYADAATQLDNEALTGATFENNHMSLWKKSVPAKTAASDGVVNGNFYFKVDSENKNWKAVTMIVEVSVDGTESNNEKFEFVINR